MLTPAEATIQRMLTEAFISADADSVVLQPREKTSNGSGGFKITDGSPRDPQVMKLVPISTTAFERNTMDGKAVTPQFVLLGYWNCEMTRGDRFVLNGKRYEVVHVQEKRDYETKGETVLLGDA